MTDTDSSATTATAEGRATVVRVLTPLVVLAPSTHEDFREFGTLKRPLRPSKTSRFLGCPMSTVLTASMHETVSSDAAQTGNLVHSAAAVYHRSLGDPEDQRVKEALDALQAARDEFPQGDEEKATKIFISYSSDPKNQRAECVEVETHVDLVLAPAPDDPTGEPIVVSGTLDQIRKEGDRLTIHDIKTGSRLNPQETVQEYLIQQAAYLLAARQSLSLDIQRAVLIWTPAYEKAKGQPFLPTGLTVKSAEVLMGSVVALVAQIRRGYPIFRPSPESCRYCPLKSYDNCFSFARGIM